MENQNDAINKENQPKKIKTPNNEKAEASRNTEVIGQLFSKDFTDLVSKYFGGERKPEDMDFTDSAEQDFALDMGAKEIDRILKILDSCEEELNDLVIGHLFSQAIKNLKNSANQVRRLLLWQFDPLTILTDETRGPKYYRRLVRMRNTMIDRLIGMYGRGEGFIKLNEHIDKGKRE